MPAPPETEKTQAPSSESIKIKVNGQEIDVPKSCPDPLTGRPVPTTMIQACALAKVDVPHYCYHPKLPVAGNCRMCLVEFGTPAIGPDRKPILNPDGSPKIAKSPRPAIACATGISPGLEIYTNTPGVAEMRRGVLEFLLINHPLDCPICDQAGECKLQEYSVDYGQADSRFVEEKVHKPKQVNLGPRIVLDDERCILCSRCIRFTRDIVGDDALGFINRGSYTTLTGYGDQPFDNNYTLNTVDICPVGALTSRDFRFKMRVWFLKETKSICNSCATGCNIVIGSREGKIYRFEPRENDAVNSSWMCDYGRLNYKWIGRADRLTQVQVQRSPDRIEDATWSSALEEIAARLQKCPPGSVGIIVSSRQSNEELYLLKTLANHCQALTDSMPRAGEADKLLLHSDRNPNTLGARLTGIISAMPGAVLPQITAALSNRALRTLIVFGEDLTRHGVDSNVLADVETLIVSDILPNATTARARYLLPGCAHVEKRGTYTNAKGRVQKFFQAVEPPGSARPEWEFLDELVARVTGRPPAGNIEALFNQMAKEVPAFAGLSWGKVGDLGASVPF